MINCIFLLTILVKFTYLEVGRSQKERLHNSKIMRRKAIWLMNKKVFLISVSLRTDFRQPLGIPRWAKGTATPC